MECEMYRNQNVRIASSRAIVYMALGYFMVHFVCNYIDTTLY